MKEQNQLTNFEITIYQQIDQTVEFLKKLIGQRCHKIIIILGSGLGESIKGLENIINIPYSDIPNWPEAKAPGHKGILISAKLENKWVLIMQGRPHMYEGNTPLQISFPIRVAYTLGVRLMIITNAAGGNTRYSTGDIMLIEDHINLIWDNGLVGPNLSRYGVRFPKMTEVYSRALREQMVKIGEEQNIRFKIGVFTAIKGPGYETRAEMRFLSKLGIQASGMSTVIEAITAAHCTKNGKMETLGISVITDIMNPNRPHDFDEEMVIAEAKKVAPKLGGVISTFVKKLP